MIGWPVSVRYTCVMIWKRGLLVVAIASSAVGCGPGADEGPFDSGPPIDAGPRYVPAGWTETPYLSEVAVRSFASVGDGTDDGVDYAAVIATDVGVLVIDLTESETPITVGSFVWLARHRYFDGLAFHRVISGFVAQTGDPNTLDMPRGVWGIGGPGYGFGLEIQPALTFDGAGVVGMARTADPSSNGSQFFITLAAQPALDGQYTVFGRVIEGADVLNEIARGEPPAAPTRMRAVGIVQR